MKTEANKKPHKKFELRFEGNIVTLITDRTKFGSIDILIRTLFYEYRKKKPEKLDELMQYLNVTHDLVKRYQQLKVVQEPNDFDVWKELHD